MRNHRTFWILALSCCAILFSTTGCFQTAGEGLQVTSVALGVTFTPSPTFAPPTETETPTPELTEESTPEIIAQVPSETPETFGQVNGQAPDDGSQLNLQATPPSQVDSSALTATAIIATATQRAAEAMTATAIALTPVVTIPPPVVTTPAPVPGVTQAPPVSGADCVHIVRQEDRNLFRISLRYGVTVHEIAARSGITNINLISIGQELIIPGCGNPGSQLPPGGSPPGSGTPYTVMQNDTLYSLSLRFGKTVHEIAANNNIANINLIYIGDTIYIP